MLLQYYYLDSITFNFIVDNTHSLARLPPSTSSAYRKTFFDVSVDPIGLQFNEKARALWIRHSILTNIVPAKYFKEQKS